MAFTSFKFIFFFMIVFIIYYSVMKEKQWQWLLIVSYVFYAMASPLYTIMLFLVTAIGYYVAIKIDEKNSITETYIKEHKEELDKEKKKEIKNNRDRYNKAYLVAGIIISLLPLIILKYSLFITENMCFIFGGHVAEDSFLYKFVLPIGLSFYTFENIGYMTDVYRGMVKPEKSIFKYMLFISYFPQILQGPIASYKDLSQNLYEKHEFNYEEASKGALRACFGFFKKMVIADNIAIIINPVFDSGNDYYGIAVIYALFMYAILLYADFSGFMDIALGCSKMLGIDLKENFETPYFSKNVPEFWRRWHISLGAWFRDYVFYSVLRSKFCDKIRKKYKEKKKVQKGNSLCNAWALIVVWLTTGIWHGANWSFIIWGIYYGIIIILSQTLRKNDGEGSKFKNTLSIAGTFLIVLVGYSIFRPENIMTTVTLWKNAVSNVGIWSLKELLVGKKIIFIISVISSLVLLIRDIVSTRVNVEEYLRKQKTAVRWAVYVALVLSILIFKAIETQSFSYFKF